MGLQGALSKTFNLPTCACGVKAETANVERIRRIRLSQHEERTVQVTTAEEESQTE